MGTIAWGDEKQGWGSRFREPELEAVFNAAMENGVNFFDTAEVRQRGATAI